MTTNAPARPPSGAAEFEPSGPAGSDPASSASSAVPNRASSADLTVPDAGKLVLTDAEIARVLDRMAHQILERTEGGDGVVLLGIPTRGRYLADRLAARITRFSGTVVAVGVLDITLYRDDLSTRGGRPLGQTIEPAGGIDGSLVILVDDVLYSGRTVRAALDALTDLGRPRAVQLAVLIDRGHRELPIRADYVGKNLPTARSESVRVRLVEHDGMDSVTIS